jgi:hypothetical protein
VRNLKKASIDTTTANATILSLDMCRVSDIATRAVSPRISIGGEIYISS